MAKEDLPKELRALAKESAGGLLYLDLTDQNKVERDLLDTLLKAHKIGFEEGFAEGFAAGTPTPTEGGEE